MKRYIVFAGVNGAGKTTLFHTSGMWKKLPRVNIDEIVRESGSWQNPQEVFEAGKKAVRLIKQFFSEGVSFNQETTLCGKGILQNIKYAKDNGYRVELHFVGLETSDIAKKRVTKRVAAGGHGVPDADIDRRYSEGLKNLALVLPLCDAAEIYDNTIEFRKIACYENGKCVQRDRFFPDWFRGIIETTD